MFFKKVLATALILNGANTVLANDYGHDDHKDHPFFSSGKTLVFGLILGSLACCCLAICCICIFKNKSVSLSYPIRPAGAAGSDTSAHGNSNALRMV